MKPRHAAGARPRCERGGCDRLEHLRHSRAKAGLDGGAAARTRARDSSDAAGAQPVLPADEPDDLVGRGCHAVVGPWECFWVRFDGLATCGACAAARPVPGRCGGVTASIVDCVSRPVPPGSTSARAFRTSAQHAPPVGTCATVSWRNGAAAGTWCTTPRTTAWPWAGVAAARARTASAGAVVDDGAQRVLLQDADLALFDLQHAVVLQLGKRAAHGLELEAEVAADLLPRHPQHQFAA